MSIRSFLLAVFIVLISLAVYLNVRYLEGLELESNALILDDYRITNIRCSYSYKMSSHIDLNYMGKEYNVEVSKGVCSDIEKGLINPKFYYMKNKDLIFYKGQYMPFPYVYLAYIVAFLLPFFGFVVYRKELNNHYSTM